MIYGTIALVDYIAEADSSSYCFSKKIVPKARISENTFSLDEFLSLADCSIDLVPKR